MAGTVKRSLGPILVRHSRSPDASLAALMKLAGMYRLDGPVPSGKFLEAENEGKVPKSAGD